ncbi:hypothetical protein J1N10_06060 [Carboxylicivirga sp. A043]|uniref:HmuY family protein n=1 Tax=Carboxylicivirga litoralis TaxID=2816963 RepID=UPI0021CAFA25|nr:HmuY family protein [Carboxylicivirga sp. A043]MCU4155532.1 hypothetical protein [Carboxylicivirga sp. A043]
MKKVLFAFAVASLGLGFTSCDDDEKITPIDYGMKTFEADYMYDTDEESAYYGNHTQQTFMKLGEEEAVHMGVMGDDSWTDFSMVADPEHEDYNISTNITGWDLAFTHYTAMQVEYPGYGLYTVTASGVLINTEEGIEVGVYDYTDSEDITTISSAFADMTLADVETYNLEYSSDIATIGYGWKTVDTSVTPALYTVNSNKFYILKMNNGDVYKLRFVSFQTFNGADQSRIAECEYALMEPTEAAE